MWSLSARRAIKTISELACQFGSGARWNRRDCRGLRFSVFLLKMLGTEPAPLARFSAPLGITRTVARLRHLALPPPAIVACAVPLRPDFFLASFSFTRPFVRHVFLPISLPEFRSRLAPHEVAHRLMCGLILVQHQPHLLGDRHLRPHPARQLTDAQAVPDAFGHHCH